ncbi:MAG: GntR family transcriptional regulator [Anaerocolumna sp.]
MNHNELSKHAVLSQWIKDNIANNTFKVGEKIPSENELASRFMFSRQTVRQAIGTLVTEGFLVREHGSGTYVRLPGKKIAAEKTMRIGVITTYLDDYVFPGIIHGIEEVLTDNGYTLSLGITHNKPSDEENCLIQIMQSGVDGLIVEGTKSALPNPNEQLYMQIQEKNIPTVFINGYYRGYNDSYIILDDVKTGRILTDLLFENGHTSIGGIFKSDDLQGIGRYEGLLKSIKNNNLTLNENSIIWYTTEDFRYFFEGTMDKILLDRLNSITGVVCYNDLVAAALIRLLKRNGKSVPEDISIVSVDNSFLSKQMVCNLTSIVYPAKKIGRKAAQILLQHINNPQKPEHIILEPYIKIRDSIKKL